MKYLLIIKKMKKTIKNLLCLFIALIALGACQNVKDGLTGKKKTNSDEFLVKKKNPLSLPPEFEKLPEPKTLVESNENNEDEIDLKKILTNNTSTTNTKSIS